MASIYFVGPYKPIMCGIADYTGFLTRESPLSRWGIISFDLQKYGAPLTSEDGVPRNQVWYGLPRPQECCASSIMEGLSSLGAGNDAVLWFQHEFGIWPDNRRFVAMLQGLALPRIVTLHTLHFQSPETVYGLERREHELLRALLPHIDAITVFSQGAYSAVSSAFPEYRRKVHIIKHGIHSCPEVALLTRKEAREKLNDFLLFESDLNETTKNILHKQRPLLDPDTFVIGQTGFLCLYKQAEVLYGIRDILQESFPDRKIVALRIGAPRDAEQASYASKLRLRQNGLDNLLLQIHLTENMLRVAQRAFDLNLYWPRDCTQSGILAHALGVGARIAGRDLEGSGEMLKEAGAIVSAGLDMLMTKIRKLIRSPEMGQRIEEGALKYAARLSWRHQAREHYELAEKIVCMKPLRLQEYSLPSFQATAIPAGGIEQLNSLGDFDSQRLAPALKQSADENKLLKSPGMLEFPHSPAIWKREESSNIEISEERRN